ncbi:PRC-barrel domain-containing protein [Candidatus Saccharibacteria bacterium]|nr:PRC-barrel domain-containing protein [Candidatus Saccharibacteria bacterium]
MLVSANRLIGTPILSMQATAQIAFVESAIVDPNSLKIIAFALGGGVVGKSPAYILDVKSIREYTRYGIVIDTIEELVEEDDVIKISEVLKLNFDLVGLKVETKKGSKLGKVSDYTVTDDNFTVQQIIVKRPLIKSFMDPELTIPRKEIVEITDYKVIVKDEEKVIRARAEKEDFVPNFVNPFRQNEQAPASTENQNPADIDRQ